MSCIFPTSHDLYLFHQGNLLQSYNMLGAHLVEENVRKGVRFSVWAPHAQSIYVVGDFNNWLGIHHPMEKLNGSGIWSCFIPGLKQGALYKYEIWTSQGQRLLKADPYAFFSELRPNTASIVYSLDQYSWQDHQWQKQKKKKDVYREALFIYEVHLGSWKRKTAGRFSTYYELAHELLPYVVEMGYTHIELLPLAEHPFDRSWGYQATGYYSITSRYGTPNEFKYFVDCCHQHGIGVILDWVPGHFCKDDHGLRLFDGTPLYEYADLRKAEKHEWGTLSFDLGKPEVQSFLISNALFWLNEYHLDGLRVDAVASMLYLDFGKEEGEWVPNSYGGRENLESVSFLRKLNEVVFQHFPTTYMVAEESTAWPLVSAPTYLGGLGFNFKWNMGWMNDMLRYMEMDAVHRKWHHELITFSFFYAFSENFLLPLSHDEVVYGKKSLLNKMPGDYWQKFAQLRLFYAYMMAHPGKKLLFMGGELGQFDEWKDEENLDWELLDYEMHRKLHNYVRHLNHFYIQEPALWQLDHQQEGFCWIDPHNANQSIISFLRLSQEKNNFLLIVCNFTPVFYENYKVGVPVKAEYVEVFNSDLESFGGSGKENKEVLLAEEAKWHNQPYHLRINIPPLATSIFKPAKLNRITEDVSLQLR